ncbi:MAG TPA: phosphatase PAP2 family protein, partial [Ktedonobacterales bacterium]|nr:phosphatase PAP2 family protein [Ktedonobacterales bacterium]
MSTQQQRQIHYRAAASSISLGVVVGIVVVLILAILFVHLAREVAENEFAHFDQTVILKIHATTSSTQTDVMRVVTDFGSPYLVILALLSLIIGAVVVWRARHYERAGILVAVIDAIAPTFTVGSALVLLELVKAIVNRPRPCTAPHVPCFFQPLVNETGPSFPSGHVVGAVTFYGMVAYLLLRSPQLHALVKAGIALLTAIIVVAIAYSRIYLGVHFPTDVIGSFLLGIAWLLSVAIAMHVMENHLRSAYTLRQTEEHGGQSP